MSMQFETAAGMTRGLNTHIARDIARKILSGELQPGVILPSEMDLGEQFGVSRTALREALKLLSSKGLLESRPKVGTRVRARPLWNMLDPQLLDWMQGMDATEEIYHQFLEFRRAIEPHATALAAVNASKEQRIELSRIYRQMCQVAEQFDQEQWVEIDTQFHRTIFIASGNCFYVPFGNVLTTIFKWFISYSSKEGGMCLNEHKLIYEAIMAGDEGAAYSASLSLMKGHKHRLKG
ncbi:FadR/GntR family transcriptional regulator [Hafnia psychrotolerans]|jgi:DNA-binding FadR family transcriptional regulator|uniref:GntR family transcriptional regulator n=1 Tax=Hafnia psychrotolerans TaxID=1477018 RepID=A0ABQ1GQZ3_9GAMM|nr:FadR/GntR family transcriptional regulator [Hafnia psychrotolerans]GGA48673.1 GntR family transcriptional regulator [Hafnia psychrotolerans]